MGSSRAPGGSFQYSVFSVQYSVFSEREIARQSHGFMRGSCPRIARMRMEVGQSVPAATVPVTVPVAGAARESVQYSVFSIQYSVFSIQCSVFSIQPHRFNDSTHHGKAESGNPETEAPSCEMLKR
jgi:hypothetical protein